MAMADYQTSITAYPAVIPYLLVADAPALIGFLERAFGAHCRFATPPMEGKIMHAEVAIGDSLIMISDASDKAPHPVHLCHYVPDTDAAYATAITAGAISVSAPETKPYGDRVAGVKDTADNLWWICTQAAVRLDN
jgi:PhnB protein